MVALADDNFWGGNDAYIAVGPGFWKWLRGRRGSDFSRSLVVVSACLTDHGPALREAIQARAYFGFNQVVPSAVAGAALHYLIGLLGQHTRSAEEAYYNIQRLAQHGQEIFAVNRTIEGTDPAMLGSMLDGWAYSPATGEVEMRTNGWLSGHMDAGRIWWMTFAGRWGQDSVTGAHNLLDCWNMMWSSGQAAGLKSPYCTNANAGNAPTQDEVAYATYLLSGKPLLGYSGTIVPRFTLHDQ